MAAIKQHAGNKWTVQLTDSCTSCSCICAAALLLKLSMHASNAWRCCVILTVKDACCRISDAAMNADDSASNPYSETMRTRPFKSVEGSAVEGGSEVCGGVACWASLEG